MLARVGGQAREALALTSVADYAAVATLTALARRAASGALCDSIAITLRNTLSHWPRYLPPETACEPLVRAIFASLSDHARSLASLELTLTYEDARLFVEQDRRWPALARLALSVSGPAAGAAGDLSPTAIGRPQPSGAILPLLTSLTLDSPVDAADLLAALTARAARLTHLSLCPWSPDSLSRPLASLPHLVSLVLKQGWARHTRSDYRDVGHSLGLGEQLSHLTALTSLAIHTSGDLDRPISLAGAPRHLQQLHFRGGDYERRPVDLRELSDVTELRLEDNWDLGPSDFVELRGLRRLEIRNDIWLSSLGHAVDNLALLEDVALVGLPRLTSLSDEFFLLPYLRHVRLEQMPHLCPEELDRRLPDVHITCGQEGRPDGHLAQRRSDG